MIFSLLGVGAPDIAAAEMGHPSVHGNVLFEEFEIGFNNDRNPLGWDMDSWFGGDWNRVRLKSEGAAPTNDPSLHGEAQLLYARLVTPFFEFQVGLRGDLEADSGRTDGRGFLAIGVEGLLPYWIEIEPVVFVSHRGDVSLRLTARHDWFLAQRLIVESKFETNVAIQRVRRFGIGRGFNDFELALRVRYEVVRKFAPYLGVSWVRLVGETADIAKTSGGTVSDVQGLAGLRFWF